ncbi:MAG: hypothetical protein RIT81_32550 [Deltaproteobacteria bacterium]
MRRAVVGLVVLCVGGSAYAEDDYDLRVGILQLQTVDNVSDRRISFSEARTTFDGATELGPTQLGLHVDARARRGWNEVTADRLDVQRLYARYGTDETPFVVDVGRVVVRPVASTLVDGARVGGRIVEGLDWTVFGGARPHPFTLAFDPSFLGGGAGYAHRLDGIRHEGGVSAQFYEGDVDRVFITENVYAALGQQWYVFGNAIVDLADGFDLTHGTLGARYRPNATLNTTVSVVHVHAIVPNRWFADWVAQERNRLGFTIDDSLLPVGTRRTSGRLRANLTIVPGLTPYASGRYDHRHEDSASGYEGRVGVKLAHVTLGYLDAGGALRDYFGAKTQLASLQLGTSFLDGLLNLDGGGAAMRTTAVQARWLFDLNGTVWLDAGAIDETLAGLQLMGLYQAFVDPEMTLHAMFLRVAYRLRG